MSDDQQQPTTPPTARRSIAERVRDLAVGARRAAHGSVSRLYRFRRLILITSGALFLLASALVTVRYVQSVRDDVLAKELTLEAALAHLEAGRYAEARRFARLYAAANSLRDDSLGDVHFIVGASIAYETDNAWDEPNRARHYGLAARYLQEAESRRYPAGRTEEGRLLLARCLIESGQYESALAPLLAIDDTIPAAKLDADRMLSIAYLKSNPPQLEQAAAHAKAFADDSQSLPNNRERASLLQAEITLAQGKLDAAEKFIQQVPDESHLVNERQMLSGRLALTRANQLEQTARTEGNNEALAESEQLYAKSIELLREALSHHASGQGLSSQASYLIGTAFRHQGELEAAQDQFFRTRKRYYNTPEGIVASLEEAEVLLELGRLEEGSSALKRTSGHITSPGQFSNPYVSDKQLRERVEAGFETLYENERFDLAETVATSLAPLVGRVTAAELHADTLHRWGNYLHKVAIDKPAEEANSLQKQGRKKYRLAGYAYTELAHQRYITPEYPAALWQAGRNFNLGRDFENASIALNAYVRTEARTERPLVLIALTNSYLSLNQLDDAIGTIEACLNEFPRDPAVFRARLLASTAYIEAGNIERAKELLEANLHQESLTPRSDVWRDSLFALGSVLHHQGRAVMLQEPLTAVSSASDSARQLQQLDDGHELLHAAIRRLAEAVARYPNAEQIIFARYQLAESYRYGSQMPLFKFSQETIESRRTTLNRQINDELSAAIRQYDTLIQIMNEKSHVSGPLSNEEEKILRNIYFARGTALYDLGDYEEAIKAYSTATSRYQHEPAAIEAYVQIAACYRRLNKPLESRGTLEQAKLVIDRISNDSNFISTTRFDREEWITLLDWLSSI